MGYSWIGLRFFQSTGINHRAPSALSVALGLPTLLIAFWNVNRLQSMQIASDFALPMCNPGELAEDNGFKATTRKGSKLQLYRMEVDQQQFDQYAQHEVARLSKLAQPLIIQAAPSHDCNCHGWVFAGGKHFLRGSAVELILRDNDYQMTCEPSAHDIVIYRSNRGEILHTGLVRTVLDDGVVLVESKWGADGRYLHLPENQPYSQNFEYYHSDRFDHTIKIQSNEVALASGQPREKKVVEVQ
jgi:hypothetical protein